MMGDFSDKSTEARHTRVPIKEMFDYIEEIKAMAKRKPPKRFRSVDDDEEAYRFVEPRSLSTTRVRQRLCDLMGTDVIRLNDRRYFKKLSDRLQEEYETAMDKQEHIRAASEEARQRRLMMGGYVKAPSDYRAVIHNEHKKKSKKKTKRKSRKNSSDKEDEELIDEVTKSNQGSSRGHTDDVETQIQKMSGSRTKSRSTSRGRESTTHNGGISGSGGKSGKRDSTSEESRYDLWYSSPPHHYGATYGSVKSTGTPKARAQSAVARYSHWESDSTAPDDSNDLKSDTMSLPDSDRKKPTKFSKQESPLVTDLRREQTVAGLYSIAEELISPIKTEEASKPKKY